jgi:hypothetical protein
LVRGGGGDLDRDGRHNLDVSFAMTRMRLIDNGRWLPKGVFALFSYGATGQSGTVACPRITE